MGHPDQELVEFLLMGFTSGFDIMYAGPMISSFPRNLRSTLEFPDEISAAIQAEVSLGHTSGPFSDPPFLVTHCSPFGAVKKSSDSSKVRLILDLSQPRGSSINEGIMEEFCSLKYTSFDDAVRMVQSIGPHTKLAKIDIKHAFRLFPVRKAD